MLDFTRAVADLKEANVKKPPQLHLREVASQVADIYVEANKDNPQKMAQTRGILRTMSPAVIGLILGEAIETEIREDLRAGWRCLKCGERKDESGKCPVCSQ